MMPPSSDDFSQLGAAAAAFRQTARQHRQRGLLVLSGARSWGVAASARVLDVFNSAAPLWVSDAAPLGVEPLPAARALQVLGREVDAVVYDAYAGFDPDAFGAVSGTIAGGGVMVLIAPALERWADFADPDYARIGSSRRLVRGRFLQRLVNLMAGHPGILVLGEGRVVQALDWPPAPTQPTPVARADSPCRSRDQAQAVAALVNVVHGHRRRPVVLISDRGRGKSAALGIAAAQLLREGAGSIIITAPRPDAVQAAFEQARRLLPAARATQNALHMASGSMTYMAPDRLIHERAPARFLLVDEAAAIPAPLLEQLLVHYARIAFATTVHGYEGTGRGFAVRFNEVLDRHTPGWTTVRLEQPIRWAPGDPLERFVFRALLLDANPAPDEAVADARPQTVEIGRVERDALAADEAALNGLFGLLITAHYRTRPYDLRLLLDAAHVSVYVARFAGHVVAAALVGEEGGMDKATATRVWAGCTRPVGQLVPEALAVHAGLPDAPLLRGARVMRIAVHPAAQGRGLGSALLQAITEQVRAAGSDYMSSSFGATPGLLRFWIQNGLLPVRVGVTRGAASGVHSTIVLRGLTPAGRRLRDRARDGLLAELPEQLADPLRELDADMVMALVRSPDAPERLVLAEPLWRDLMTFGFGRRVYEACMAPMGSLARAALLCPATLAALRPEQRAALISKVLQRRSWPAVARVSGVPGRRDAQRLLRGSVRALIERWAPGRVVEEGRRLMTLCDD